MATESLKPLPDAEGAFADWRSYHIFYHGDRDAAILELIQPLLHDLLWTGQVDRFFFVRYDVGGPHLRLRLRLTASASDPVTEALVESHCSRFFQNSPSPSSATSEQIRRVNRMVLRLDPGAGVDETYSNHSWRRFPLLFEVERYGGNRNFTYSLDLFCLSSLAALRWLQQKKGESGSHEAMIRLAVQICCGFAATEDEFLSILDFGACFRRRPLRLEEERISQARTIIENELATLATASALLEPPIMRVARAAAQQLQALHVDERTNIAMSHIHMTANRLGLSNADEAVLSQTITQAAGLLKHQMRSRLKSCQNDHHSLRFHETAPEDVLSREIDEFAGRSSRLSGHPLRQIG
jgi:Lantibiotic biosynthesis dehydratase C-term